MLYLKKVFVNFIASLINMCSNRVYVALKGEKDCETNIGVALEHFQLFEDEIGWYYIINNKEDDSIKKYYYGERN